MYFCFYVDCHSRCVFSLVPSVFIRICVEVPSVPLSVRPFGKGFSSYLAVFLFIPALLAIDPYPATLSLSLTILRERFLLPLINECTTRATPKLASVTSSNMAVVADIFWLWCRRSKFYCYMAFSTGGLPNKKLGTAVAPQFRGDNCFSFCNCLSTSFVAVDSC